MESFDIMKYIEMALRRKYWIIIPFLLTVLGGLTYILIAPKIYEAQTLILVQPQKVPSEYIRSIVSTGIEERLKTISQQVTSRTNLESIIKEHRLYSDSKMIIESKVELCRKRININVAGGAARRGSGTNSFEIIFQGEDPEKVMKVTNTLASNFISENLKIRESQALGTSSFLADELEAISKRLGKKEELFKEYRQKFMGAMPEELQTNLRILERLQMQVEQLYSSLRDAENRKLIIQKQIADSEMMQKQIAEAGMGSFLIEMESSPLSEEEGSVSLRRQLALLKGRYTDNHPDVRRLNKMIARIEEEESKSEAEEFSSEPEAGESEVDLTEIEPVLPMMDDFLKPQLQQIDIEAKDIRVKIQKVQSKMKVHQKRVEETPKRELELITLKRDYENLKALYSSMLNRKLEAELAVSMEKKQKGEQFRVIDPAKVPVRPVEPDARKIIILTLILGLGLGGGLAYLMEFMDTSYMTPEEVEKELKLPVLINIPIRYTEKELKRQLRKKVLMAASVAVGFILSASGIVIAVKGVDATLLFIKNIIKL